MWDKLKKILGYAWASPVTGCGLLYVGLFTLLGWYDWHGVRGDALVWTVNEDVPKWLCLAWQPWAGHAVGNVVVMRQIPGDTSVILTHEQKHVDQCMRLGVFQPIIYLLSMVAIKFGCPGSDPYFSNPFEIDARRHAGQLIDVEGAVKKFKDVRKKS
jgi:hypothetical protein